PRGCQRISVTDEADGVGVPSESHPFNPLPESVDSLEAEKDFSPYGETSRRGNGYAQTLGEGL
ncbi:MAG: hypothetical protein NZT92_22380, partial [Abditibacteriales bacterium]|nr:hypothetical protein [Abditibacteriales bacterium]